MCKDKEESKDIKESVEEHIEFLKTIGFVEVEGKRECKIFTIENRFKGDESD